MQIRKTVEADLCRIGEIYENAKRFMQKSGNPNQWNKGTPNVDTAREDMERGVGYVVEENNEVKLFIQYVSDDGENFAPGTYYIAINPWVYTDGLEFTFENGKAVYENYFGGIVGNTCAESGFSILVEDCTYTNYERGLGNTALPDIGEKK